MFTQKKELIRLSIRMVLIVWAAFFPRVASALVWPDIVDFGETALNTTSGITLYIINLNQTSSTTVSLSFSEGECGFSVEVDRLDIPADESEGVDIHYTPTVLGECSDNLRIVETLDLDSGELPPELLVLVRGVGIEDQKKQTTLSLLEFFDESVEAGTLTGYGPGESADWRLNALRKMIVTASEMIERENMRGAYGLLGDLLERIDPAVGAAGGSNRSSSMATGSMATGAAAAELANMIRQIRDGLL